MSAQHLEVRHLTVAFSSFSHALHRADIYRYEQNKVAKLFTFDLENMQNVVKQAAVSQRERER